MAATVIDTDDTAFTVSTPYCVKGTKVIKPVDCSGGGTPFAAIRSAATDGAPAILKRYVDICGATLIQEQAVGTRSSAAVVDASGITVTAQMNATGAGANGANAVAIGARVVEGELRLNYNVVDTAGSRVSSGLAIPILIDISTNPTFAGVPYLKVKHYVPESSSFETLTSFYRVGDTTVYSGTLTVNEDLVLEAPSNDTSLDVFTLNGVSMASQQNIDVSGSITSVPYVLSVTAATSSITYGVNSGQDLSGSVSLVPGSNIFSFRVTAEDGTYVDVSRTINRLSNDTSATITVAGSVVTPGSTLDLSSSYTYISISIGIAAGASRTEVTETTTGLTPGATYSYTFTVTAEDGTTKEYSFSVHIKSNATGLSKFTLNTIDVSNGRILDLSASVTIVDISAVPVAGATRGPITGQLTGLTPGGTYVYGFRVTAEDTDVWEDYTVNVRIASLPQELPPSGGIPCIPAGQRVLTPMGYRAIETLRQGDLIKTPDGRPVPVRVFTTTVEKTTPETAPVRIGALRLSPSHTFKVSKHGWMFPCIAVAHRLHGATQEAPGARVVYYHLETPDYLRDDIVVEGVTVESYGARYVLKHNIDVSTLYSLSVRNQYFIRLHSVYSKRMLN